MSDLVAGLLDALNLEQLDENRFRGRSIPTAWLRVFGGQTVAQALVATQRTVTDSRRVHSLHAYFLLAGDSSQPIDYEVDRIRDGGSFTTRRAVAYQNGNAIFTLAASFQTPESGLDHQVDLPPGLPGPDEVESQDELIARLGDAVPAPIRSYWLRERPIEMRPVVIDHYITRNRLDPKQHVWVRFAGKTPDDNARRSALLAYLSDMTLLDTSTFAHGRMIFDQDIQAASLDHAMWFHRDHPLNDWLLYTQDSPSSSGARGFTRGALYARDGTLIASVAQEGLIRLRSQSK